MSEGSSFITINPATLDDESLWSYADLRKLCKKLQLGAKGKRLELVGRLQSWHKLRVNDRAALAAIQKSELGDDEGKGGDDDDDDSQNWIPLNVEGSNFSILSQNITASPGSCPGSEASKAAPKSSPSKGSQSARKQLQQRQQQPPQCGSTIGDPTEPLTPQRTRAARRESLGMGLPVPPLGQSPPPSAAKGKSKKSLLGFDSREKQRVSPTLLKPLTTYTGDGGTPGKSILRCARSPRPSASKISFSPFNGTKVIPNRSKSPDDGIGGLHPRDSYDDESDESDEDWDENYVDATARLNAERNTQLADEAGSDESDSDSDCCALWERID